MIVDKDFEFVNTANTEFMCVKVLTEDYKDVVFHFGVITPEERDDELYISFDFTVLESGDTDMDKLADDANFHTVVSDILNTILVDSLTKYVTSNETDDVNS
jgi:hypothetical protein